MSETIKLKVDVTDQNALQKLNSLDAIIEKLKKPIKIEIQANGLQNISKEATAAVNAQAKLATANARIAESEAKVKVEIERTKQARAKSREEIQKTAQAQSKERQEIEKTKQERAKEREEIQKTAQAQSKEQQAVEKTKQARANARAEIQKTVQAQEKSTQATEKTIQAQERTVQAVEKTVQAQEKSIQMIEKTEQEQEKSAQATEKTRQRELELQIQQEKNTGVMAKMQGQIAKNTNAFGGYANVLDMVKAKFLWFVSAKISQAPFVALNEALETLKSVDTELTNIQKVTDAPDSVIKSLGENAFSVASQYGIKANDFLAASAEFAKAGYSNYADMAELATKTQLVGDVTASMASKFLLSADAAYKFNGSIESLSTVLDKANTIENNYATSIEKLTEGFPVVASTASMANMSIDELMAALGTITSVTQESGTKASTAMRALILNIEGEIGAVVDEEEGLEVTKESVESVADALKKYGSEAIKAAQATGSIIDPMEAIRSLSEAFKRGDLSENELFQLLSGVGGKLRTNQLAALVKNFDMYEEMLGKVQGSAGSADKEVSVMLDSWNAKTNILKNTFTEFVSNLVNTDVIKGGLDGITKLVSGLDTETGRFVITATALYTIGQKLITLAVANPFSAVLTVLSVSAVAIAGEVKELTASYEESTEALHNMQNTLKSSTKEFEDSKSKIEAQANVAEYYVGKLEELQKKTDKTSEDHEDWNRILNEMVDVIPELADYIDTENGLIKGGTDAIREQIQAWKDLALTKAYEKAIEDKSGAIIDARIGQKTAEVKAKNAEDLMRSEFGYSFTEAQNRLAEIYENSRKTAEALNAQLGDNIYGVFDFVNQDEVDNINEAIAEISGSDAFKEWNNQQKAVEDYTQALKDAEEELEIAKQAFDEFKGEESGESNSEEKPKTSDFSEEIKRDTGASSQAAEATRKAVEDSMNSAVSAVKDSSEEVSTTAKEIGESVPQEFANGLNDNSAVAKAAADGLMAAISSEVFSQRSGLINAIARVVDIAKQFIAGLFANSSMSYGHNSKGTVTGIGAGNYNEKMAEYAAMAEGTTNAKGGYTLVNELGAELISENGRAYIANNGKPAVVNLSKGAIVIPAKQTKEALKNGAVPKYAAYDGFNYEKAKVGIDGTHQEYSFENNGVTYKYDAVYDSNGNHLYTELVETKGTPQGGGGGNGGGGHGGGGSGGGTKKKNTKSASKMQSELDEALSSLELKIQLATNEGDYARVVELYEEARKLIADAVQSYKDYGYEDDSDEIITLLNQNYDYMNKQLDVYRERWSELITALDVETEAQEKANDLAEKREALDKANESLSNAQKNRTARVYNAETGQWEWIADQSKIDSAQKSLDSAQKNYNNEVKSQAIEELKKISQTETDLSNVVLGDALSAVAMMAETSEEFQNFARAIEAVFGVGSFLNSTAGSTEHIATKDSHDTMYTFGDVSLTPEQASSMSVAELAQMLKVLEIT